VFADAFNDGEITEVPVIIPADVIDPLVVEIDPVDVDILFVDDIVPVFDIPVDVNNPVVDVDPLIVVVDPDPPILIGNAVAPAPVPIEIDAPTLLFPVPIDNVPSVCVE